MEPFNVGELEILDCNCFGGIVVCSYVVYWRLC